MDGEERKRELDESYGSMAAMDPRPVRKRLYPPISMQISKAQSSAEQRPVDTVDARPPCDTIEQHSYHEKR